MSPITWHDSPSANNSKQTKNTLRITKNQQRQQQHIITVNEQTELIVFSFSLGSFFLPAIYLLSHSSCTVRGYSFGFTSQLIPCLFTTTATVTTKFKRSCPIRGSARKPYLKKRKETEKTHGLCEKGVSGSTRLSAAFWLVGWAP